MQLDSFDEIPFSAERDQSRWRSGAGLKIPDLSRPTSRTRSSPAFGIGRRRQWGL